MSEHTPEPWKVKPSYGNGTIPLYFDIVCHAGHGIGMASTNEWPYDGNEVGVEEAEANARLMAAAPELLAAAYRVASLNEHAGEIGAGMLASLIEDARAAVAKATGGEG